MWKDLVFPIFLEDGQSRSDIQRYIKNNGILNRNRRWKKKVYLKSDSLIGGRTDEWWIMGRAATVLKTGYPTIGKCLLSVLICIGLYLSLYLLSYFLLSFALYFLPFLSYGWWPSCHIIIVKHSCKNKKKEEYRLMNIQHKKSPYVELLLSKT